MASSPAAAAAAAAVAAPPRAAAAATARTAVLTSPLLPPPLLCSFDIPQRWYHDLSVDSFAESTVYASGRGGDLNIDCHRAGEPSWQLVMGSLAELSVGSPGMGLSKEPSCFEGELSRWFNRPCTPYLCPCVPTPPPLPMLYHTPLQPPTTTCSATSTLARATECSRVAERRAVAHRAVSGLGRAAGQDSRGV